MSPTQLTLRKLKRDGWPLVRVVEKWNAFARRRQDLFGFDVLAIRQNEQLWVQATSASNVNARVNKLTAMRIPLAMESRQTGDVVFDIPAYVLIKRAGIRCAVWGWAKNKSGRYELKREVEL